MQLNGSTDNHRAIESYDSYYYKFRFGTENNNTKEYYVTKKVGNLGLVRFPRYTNSFYFYFGINSGSTAIDKFNRDFYSSCVNIIKDDFIVIPKVIQNEIICPCNPNTISKVSVQFIVRETINPYSYQLVESDTNNVIAENTNMSERLFTITNGDSVLGSNTLKKGVYYIVIEDNVGNRVTKDFEIESMGYVQFDLTIKNPTGDTSKILPNKYFDNYTLTTEGFLIISNILIYPKGCIFNDPNPEKVNDYEIIVEEMSFNSEGQIVYKNPQIASQDWIKNNMIDGVIYIPAKGANDGYDGNYSVTIRNKNCHEDSFSTTATLVDPLPLEFYINGVNIQSFEPIVNNNNNSFPYQTFTDYWLRIYKKLYTNVGTDLRPDVTYPPEVLTEPDLLLNINENIKAFLIMTCPNNSWLDLSGEGGTTPYVSYLVGHRTLSFKGSNYTAGVVILTQKTNTSATGTITVDGNGKITTIAITNGGSGYENGVINITQPNSDNNASAIIQITDRCTITNINNITNSGSGYSLGDVIIFQDQNINATAKITGVDSNGGITAIAITNGGSDYDGNKEASIIQGENESAKIEITVDCSKSIKGIEFTMPDNIFAQPVSYDTIDDGKQKAPYLTNNSSITGEYIGYDKITWNGTVNDKTLNNNDIDGLQVTYSGDPTKEMGGYYTALIDGNGFGSSQPLGLTEFINNKSDTPFSLIDFNNNKQKKGSVGVSSGKRASFFFHVFDKQMKESKERRKNNSFILTNRNYVPWGIIQSGGIENGVTYVVISSDNSKATVEYNSMSYNSDGSGSGNTFIGVSNNNTFNPTTTNARVYQNQYEFLGNMEVYFYNGPTNLSITSLLSSNVLALSGWLYGTELTSIPSIRAITAWDNNDTKGKNVIDYSNNKGLSSRNSSNLQYVLYIHDEVNDCELLINKNNLALIVDVVSNDTSLINTSSNMENNGFRKLSINFDNSNEAPYKYCLIECDNTTGVNGINGDKNPETVVRTRFAENVSIYPPFLSTDKFIYDATFTKSIVSSNSKSITFPTTGNPSLDAQIYYIIIIDSENNKVFSQPVDMRKNLTITTPIVISDGIIVNYTTGGNFDDQLFINKKFKYTLQQGSLTNFYSGWITLETKELSNTTCTFTNLSSIITSDLNVAIRVVVEEKTGLKSYVYQTLYRKVMNTATTPYDIGDGVGPRLIECGNCVGGERVYSNIVLEVGDTISGAVVSTHYEIFDNLTQAEYLALAFNTSVSDLPTCCGCNPLLTSMSFDPTPTTFAFDPNVFDYNISYNLPQTLATVDIYLSIDDSTCNYITNPEYDGQKITYTLYGTGSDVVAIDVSTNDNSVTNTYTITINYNTII
jgi:hypothetical protein